MGDFKTKLQINEDCRRIEEKRPIRRGIQKRRTRWFKHTLRPKEFFYFTLLKGHIQHFCQLRVSIITTTMKTYTNTHALGEGEPTQAGIEPAT
jgi:hypothetical protein